MSGAQVRKGESHVSKQEKRRQYTYPEGKPVTRFVCANPVGATLKEKATRIGEGSWKVKRLCSEGWEDHYGPWSVTNMEKWEGFLLENRCLPTEERIASVIEGQKGLAIFQGPGRIMECIQTD